MRYRITARYEREFDARDEFEAKRFAEWLAIALRWFGRTTDTPRAIAKVEIESVEEVPQ